MSCRFKRQRQSRAKTKAVLLEALEDMVEMATHHAMPLEERLAILRKARAAIAKAKGTPNV